VRGRLMVVVAVVVVVGLPARVSAASCAAGAACGTVSVPVDWTDPSAGSLAIAYELFAHRLSDEPAAGTLVPLAGGPGGSNTAFPNDWTQMYGELLDRFDLLLVDNRGTGQSGAIDCNALQHQGTSAANVADCARQIGPARDLYRSASVARDLDAVRAALGIEKIDLYGFSWGSVQARGYAARFGGHLRSLILDSAGQNLDVVAWASERARLHRDQVALLCRRSPTCRAAGGDPVADVTTLVAKLRRHPVTGATFDSRGSRVRLQVDEATLWSIFGGPGLIQIPAAARALARGDKRPLLRTVAENRVLPTSADSGDPTRFSRGDSLAVLCNEQRFPWDWSTTSAARRTQWESALAALPPGSFGPFSAGAVSADPQESAAACREWPAPASSEPPVPDGAMYPAVPALFVGGDLDGAVPDVARAYASQFPASSYVEFANVGHGAAFSGPCATAILRRFVSELAPGDTSCAAHPVPIFGYSTFPRRARDVRTRVRRLPGDRSLPRDRLAAAAAVETVIDAAIHGTSGHGLRGGQCARTPTGDLTLHRCRFVEDVAVSGSGHVDLTATSLSARVRLAGTSKTRLRIKPRGSNLVVSGDPVRRSIRLLVVVDN
jgi:pimeloyl-ACP methyl ester carboxylesterase